MVKNVISFSLFGQEQKNGQIMECEKKMKKGGNISDTISTYKIRWE